MLQGELRSCKITILNFIDQNISGKNKELVRKFEGRNLGTCAFMRSSYFKHTKFEVNLFINNKVMANLEVLHNDDDNRVMAIP